jgi:hypothetical protein
LSELLEKLVGIEIEAEYGGWFKAKVVLIASSILDNYCVKYYLK